MENGNNNQINMECKPITFEIDTNYQTPLPICELMVDLIPQHILILFLIKKGILWGIGLMEMQKPIY